MPKNKTIAPMLPYIFNVNIKSVVLRPWGYSKSVSLDKRSGGRPRTCDKKKTGRGLAKAKMIPLIQFFLKSVFGYCQCFILFADGVPIILPLLLHLLLTKKVYMPGVYTLQ